MPNTYTRLSELIARMKHPEYGLNLRSKALDMISEHKLIGFELDEQTVVPLKRNPRTVQDLALRSGTMELNPWFSIMDETLRPVVRNAHYRPSAQDVADEEFDEVLAVESTLKELSRRRKRQERGRIARQEKTPGKTTGTP